MDAWRSPALLKIDEETNEELTAAFCTGKQVEVDMPATWRPCHTPLTVEVKCVKFRSDEIPSTAGSPADNMYKLKPLMKQLQVSKPETLSKWAALGRGTTPREVLRLNFPRAVILVDYAKLSV